MKSIFLAVLVATCLAIISFPRQAAASYVTLILRNIETNDFNEWRLKPTNKFTRTTGKLGRDSAEFEQTWDVGPAGEQDTILVGSAERGSGRNGSGRQHYRFPRALSARRRRQRADDRYLQLPARIQNRRRRSIPDRQAPGRQHVYLVFDVDVARTLRRR